MLVNVQRQYADATTKASRQRRVGQLVRFLPIEADTGHTVALV